uniref:Coat protein n=1 Tax=Rabbit luteovirus TaxID=2697570 RepID=A0A6B9QQW4_9LUTE|nr:coat protein [Rabbit luteovirus]
MPPKRKNAKKKGKKPRRVVVVQPAKVVSARPRRARRRRNGRGRGQGQNQSHEVDFKMTVDSIKGNDSGTIKFGPSTACQQLRGNIAAYSKYRITWLKVWYITEASSTDRGAISYHIDTSTKGKPADLHNVTTWTIRLNGQAEYTAPMLQNTDWYEQDKDQFYFLYKGSGEGTVAGHFLFRGRVKVLNESL